MAGTFCDAVGGLYLTYELFKRHAGPLGVLTRLVTYSVVLGLPFWIALGPAFGAIAGLGFGLLISVDFWWLARTQRLHRQSPLRQSALAGAARGVVLGVASMPRYSADFGLIVGGIAAALLAAVYGLGYVPTYRAYQSCRWMPPWSSVRAALMRGAASGAAVGLAALLEPGRASAALAPELAALVGGVSVFVAVLNPHIEWRTENASDSFFIAAGVTLLAIGLTFDMVPHAVTLLGLRAR